MNTSIKGWSKDKIYRLVAAGIAVGAAATFLVSAFLPAIMVTLYGTCSEILPFRRSYTVSFADSLFPIMVLAIILETVGIYRGLKGRKTRLMMASVALASPFLVGISLVPPGVPAPGNDPCTGDFAQPLLGFYVVAFSLVGMLIASVLFDMIRFSAKKTPPNDGPGNLTSI